MSPRLLLVDECPHCGEQLPERGLRTCPHCGGSLQQRYLQAGCLSSSPVLLFAALAALWWVAS
ncbi:MAG: hypothetical protein MK297_13035 [Planctomycetes bacterium]|nr:hypothetical protein [Planctomycetota bacterium]